MSVETDLNQLVDRLRKAYEERLVSVVLYGSAAVGDHHGSFSDLNVLCVLREVTVRELGESASIFRWWRDKGNPAPLLLSLEEVQDSTDCFPIEFHDIRERHRVLHGEDVVKDLELSRVFYRAQVEHDLRAKLLRLRQKAAGVLEDRDLLLQLMAESISTFCVLFRHALLLYGVEAQFEKRAVVSQAAEKFGIEARPFQTLLDLRERKVKAREIQPGPLFESYLKEIGVVVGAVDRLEK
jgi:predicted nucleotidyltransferase